MGGILGALLVLLLGWWQQRRQDRREYLAALRVLRDELRHNIGVCHSLGPLGLDPRLVEPLRRESYMSLRLTLAKHLPQSLRVEVARSYALLERDSQRRALLQEARASGHSEFAGIERFEYGRLRDRLADVDQMLRRHLSEMRFHREVELGPTELAGWQLRDPKTGLTPFDAVGKSVARVTIDMLPALQVEERKRAVK